MRTIYWLLPLFLSCFQLAVTLASMNHIHSEELAESVRNVFWLQHGLIYDGGSSNIGWYGTLLLVYKLFGFGLFTAKFVRLALHVISLYCAAEILRRYLGMRNAIVPLAVFGLSPTLLYYNTFQTSNGMDLDYFVICLVIALSVRVGPANALELGKTFLVWMLAMVAAMTYPVFLFYLPSLAFISVAFFRSSGKAVPTASKAGHILSGLAGFVVPLLAALLFLPSVQLLIRDPATGTGLFRGGGRAGFDPALFKASILVVLRDLFVAGDSYYFQLTSPDYSGVLAMASVACIASTALYLALTKKACRPVLAASFLLLAVSLILPNTSISGLPGLRRCTGILAAGYVLFAVVWNFYAGSNFRNSLLKRAGLLLCLLLPVSCLFKLEPLLADVRKAGADPAQGWFSIKGNPAESLAYVNTKLEKGGLVLACRDAQGNALPCDYWGIYSALAGNRLWNGLTNIEIKALDWKTGTNVTLAPSLWTSYYFPH